MIRESASDKKSRLFQEFVVAECLSTPTKSKDEWKSFIDMATLMNQSSNFLSTFDHRVQMSLAIGIVGSEDRSHFTDVVGMLLRCVGFDLRLCDGTTM